MANILFASEDYIKQNTQIYSNVETADLLPFVLRTQDIEIQQLLGTELYQHLLSAIAGNTLNSDESNLVLQIQPCLAHYTAYYALPFNWAKFTARGVINQTAEHANPITLKDIQFLRDECRNIAEFYGQRIIDYLLAPENSGKFPLYYAANARKIKPEMKTTYNPGIYLGDAIPTPLKDLGWVN